VAKGCGVETVAFRVDDSEDSPVILVEISGGDMRGLPDSAGAGRSGGDVPAGLSCLEPDGEEPSGVGDWFRVRQSKVTLDEALSSLTPLVGKVRDKIVALGEHRPDTVELSMGLKFSATTSVKIASAAAEGQLTLKMTWTEGAGNEKTGQG